LLESINQQNTFDVYNLKDYSISSFDYKHKNINDDFIPLIKELLKYDHIVFASPVYWYSMTSQMKVFFDRLSDLLHVKKKLGRKLRGKLCSIISTGASAEPERSFEETFINSFEYLDMNYKGMLYCYCEEKFEESLHKTIIDYFLQNNLFKSI
jgi:multimeric flavodoxin WrbA